MHSCSALPALPALAPATARAVSGRDGWLFLPAELRSDANPADKGDIRAEFLQFFRIGVDGLFTDFPDLAVAARADFEAARP